MRIKERQLKKSIYTSIIMVSFFNFFQKSFGGENNFSHSDSIERACELGNNSSALKLNYSQRTENQNSFLVAWDFKKPNELDAWQKPEVGGEIVITRCLPPGRYVVVAQGSVNKLNGSLVEAEVRALNSTNIVLGKETNELNELRNLVWRPMVGDEVLPVYKKISKAEKLSPIYTLSNNSLFIKLGENNYSYELSEDGKSLLREKFTKFANRRGRLLVQGFALHAGNKEQVRSDTLMRAQSVSSFLIREFNLDDSRILSFGYGNDWLQPGMQAVHADYHKNNDSGIILKILANE